MLEIMLDSEDALRKTDISLALKDIKNKKITQILVV